jgi:hypothetical protein
MLVFLKTLIVTASAAQNSNEEMVSETKVERVCLAFIFHHNLNL